MWTKGIDDNRGRNGRRIGAYLFALALAIHVCYLCQYARTPFFWVPELDSLFDDLAARSIAAGHVSHDPFFRAPLYLYFLAGIYKVFGHSFWAARLTQAVIGSASVVLLYRLGARLFRPSIAMAAAVGMAFYGPLVYNDGELHTPVIEVFLDVLLLNLAIGRPRPPNPQSWGNRTDGSRADIGRWIACGLVMGLSAITRPTILVTVPIILWWIFAYNRPRWGQFAAVFLAACILFPAIVTVRNWRVSGDPVFIASQGGINLFIGNRPSADGFTPSTPTQYRFDDEYEDSVALYGQRAAEEAEGRPLTASETQSYWVRRSIDWWQTAPADALRLTGKKIVLAWTHQETRNNTAFDFVRRELAPFLWICCVGFWVVGPLAITGIFFAFNVPCFGSEKHGDAESGNGQRVEARGSELDSARRLTAFVLVYLAGVVPFFMADRYRLPVVPALLLLAAYGGARLVELWRSRSTKALVVAMASLAAGIVLVDVDWVRTSTPKTWAIDYWSEGNRYVRMGRLDQAEAAFGKALKLDPGNGDIWNGMGEALYDEGKLVDAAVCFRRSALCGPDVSRADYNEAVCLEQLGNVDGARSLLTDAVEIDPSYTLARRELCQLPRRVSEFSHR